MTSALTDVVVIVSWVLLLLLLKPCRCPVAGSELSELSVVLTASLALAVPPGRAPLSSALIDLPTLFDSGGNLPRGTLPLNGQALLCWFCASSLRLMF